MRRIALFALALALAFSGCGPKPLGDVTVDRENSFLSDFTVEGGQVLMACHIKLKNACAEDRWVELRARSPGDVIGGLLASPELSSPERFLVPANGSAAYEVTFVGKHGRGERKLNRLLPDITVIDAK
ncbi:MAG: hypothetical protein FWF60_09120 [Oscillospiraceae bacterium]|nr:hypothetical protein [Oscillospiraceae bacterium]